jgi:sterol desaturase/sphingolipid hydroxylase (fatty acid hydroxylase superfamily)
MLPLCFDDAGLMAAALFALTQSLTAYANVAGHPGPLDCLIGSVGLHRLHHSTREGGAGDFGAALPIGDQLFCTYRRGPAPAEVGVFDPRFYPGELRLRELLLWPFACAPCVRVARCCRA